MNEGVGAFAEGEEGRQHEGGVRRGPRRPRAVAGGIGPRRHRVKLGVLSGVPAGTTALPVVLSENGAGRGGELGSLSDEAGWRGHGERGRGSVAKRSKDPGWGAWMGSWGIEKGGSVKNGHATPPVGGERGAANGTAAPTDGAGGGGGGDEQRRREAPSHGPALASQRPAQCAAATARIKTQPAAMNRARA